MRDIYCGGKNILVPTCSGAECPVAPIRVEEFKEVKSRVCGVCDLFFPFRSWRSTSLGEWAGVHQWSSLQSSQSAKAFFCLLAEPNQTVIINSYSINSYWSPQNRLSDGWIELYQQLMWQVEFPQVVVNVHSILDFFHNGVNLGLPLQVLWDFRAQELERLHGWHCTVHYVFFLKSTVSSTVLSKSSSAPGCFDCTRQSAVGPHLFKQTWHHLDETNDCSVICKRPEFDRMIFNDADVFIQEEEQWGEQTSLRSLLIVQVLDINYPSLNCCYLSVRKLVIHRQMDSELDQV